MVQEVSLYQRLIAMRSATVRIVLFLFSFMLFSCKVEVPENVLPPEKMEAILYDYHLTASMTTMYASVTYKEKLMYAYVYDKHGVTKEDFDSSLVWYNRYPKYIKDIYTNLEERLQQEVDALTAVRLQDNEGVTLSLADLSPAVAELWTGHPVKMLSAKPLGNRVQFSFDTPKDTTFVVGDSLLFSFNAEFIPGSKPDVMREAYASVVLEYDNEKYYATGVNVKESGAYTVSAPRDFKNRLRSMSGYIYYFDNDSAHESYMLLSDISLKRFHPVKTENNKQ